ncbi:hypothetical protein C9439_02685 [archaeon SCG-AAA382B04]|nr:hypothetical protein C9439_02685 [archaeon SCG-AAA382B04]
MPLELGPELRKELKQPFGDLYKNIDQIIDELKPRKSISVGDLITYNLIKKDFYPKIAIIDEKIERKPSDKLNKILNSPKYKEIQVKNPAGYITNELINEIKKAISRTQKTIININGEEDLAVIPSIKFAPQKHQIIYGQPRKGVVRVKVNQEVKQKIKKIIERMR